MARGAVLLIHDLAPISLGGCVRPSGDWRGLRRWQRDWSGRAAIRGGLTGADGLTDISKAGDDLSLKWDADVQGQTMPLTLILTPDGDGLKVSLDFAGMGAMEGTGTR